MGRREPRRVHQVARGASAGHAAAVAQSDHRQGYRPGRWRARESCDEVINPEEEVLTQQTNAPVPGSPEHDAAMIALAESQGVRLRTGDATSGQTTEIVAGSEADPS